MWKPDEHCSENAMVTKVRSTTFGKAFVALLLTACYGCSRSKAHHESEFVHREPAGATYVRGMTYRRTGAGPRSPESDQGWGGSKITVGIAAGKAEFAFILLRHRSGRDVYRVTRTIWPERGKPNSGHNGVLLRRRGGHILR